MLLVPGNIVLGSYRTVLHHVFLSLKICQGGKVERWLEKDSNIYRRSLLGLSSFVRKRFQPVSPRQEWKFSN